MGALQALEAIKCRYLNIKFYLDNFFLLKLLLRSLAILKGQNGRKF